MKPTKGIALSPRVTVNELNLADNEDWYTPKALKLAPLQVRATLGQKGKGRVRCEIEECEWERSCIDLKLIFETAPGTGAHYNLGLHSNIDNEFGNGTAGTFTRQQIDWLIEGLIAARTEAEKLGLFTVRPTPSSIQQVLTAGKS